MTTFEDIGRKIDSEVEKLRTVVENEVSPATRLKAASRCAPSQKSCRALPLTLNPKWRLRNSTLADSSSGLASRSSNRYRVWRLVSTAILLAFVAAGCAPRHRVAVPLPPPPSPVVPGLYVEQGVASWYGNPFNGRRAANGEVYDMETGCRRASHSAFWQRRSRHQFAKWLSTEVRIIDRGPFAKGRIIDLSFAAARQIDMVGTGTAQVKIELLASPSPAPLTGTFAVQIGAFRSLKTQSICGINCRRVIRWSCRSMTRLAGISTGCSWAARQLRTRRKN